MSLYNEYCRLCANLHTKDDTVKTNLNSLTPYYLLPKIKLLNISCLDFEDPFLPKKVCKKCVINVENAADFIESIEAAQESLKAIYLTNVCLANDLSGNWNRSQNASIGSSHDNHLKKEPYDEDNTSLATLQRLGNNIKQNNVQDIEIMSLKPEIETSGTKFRQKSDKYAQINCAAKSQDIDMPQYNVEGFSEEISAFASNVTVNDEVSYIDIEQETKNDNNNDNHNKVLEIPKQLRLRNKCDKRTVKNQKLDKIKKSKQSNNLIELNVLNKRSKFKMKHAENVEDNNLINPNSDPEAPEDTNNVPIRSNSDDINEDAGQLKVLEERQQLSWQSFIWICSACETQFQSYEELITHSMKVHNTCALFQCPRCKSRSRVYYRFIKHVNRHFSKHSHMCLDCLDTFSIYKDYLNHVKSHENSNKNVCINCNMKFAEKSILQEHQLQFVKDRNVFVVNKKTEKNLTCEVCNKTLSSPTYLKKHKLLHTNIRNKEYACVCDICGHGCYSKTELEYHKITHSEVKKHKCIICNLSFKTLMGLRLHLATHETARPFSCETCGKTFRLKPHLTKHTRIHSDVNPYVCSVCNKAFKFKNRLTNHLKQHTGSRPYKCGVCEKSFTNWPNYNLHMKKSHGMNMAKKKKTDDGRYVPIDPVTGDVLVEPPATSTEEWKNSVMEHRKKGPRQKLEM